MEGVYSVKRPGLQQHSENRVLIGVKDINLPLLSSQTSDHFSSANVMVSYRKGYHYAHSSGE
jgi:hypothetical protein